MRIRVLKHKAMIEAKRTHAKLHITPLPRTWDPVKLDRANRWSRHLVRTLQAMPTYRDPLDVRGAIDFYFGRYADEAWAVTACESTHSIYDQLGQYLGLFQMGDYAPARATAATTAANADAWSQAKAAWGYFSDSGYDWSPWSCKPDGSVRYPG